MDDPVSRKHAVVRTDSTSHRFLFLVCLPLALIVYSRALTTHFLSDDFDLIGHVITDGFFVGWAGFLRPIIVLTYVLDLTVWGLNPIGYHLTNVLLHTVNAVLVGALVAALLRMFGSEVRREVPALAAAIFLVLPCHTEAVTWIAGRTDLVASGFLLLALLAHLRFLETPRRSFMTATLAAFALALLSKESAVVFPAVVVVLTLAVTRRLRIVLLSAVPLVLILAGYAALRWLVVGRIVGQYVIDAHLEWDAPRTLWHVVASSVRVFLPPLSPTVVDLMVRNWYMSPRRWLALSIAASLLAVLAARIYRHHPRAAGWQLFALVACFWLTLPLLGNQGVSLDDTRGERFLYFPSVFVVTAIAWLTTRVSRHARLLTIGFAAWILASSVALWHLNGTWAAAGRLSERLATEIAVLATNKVVIVTNVPDHYNGAWVFRNGLSEAVRLFRRPAPSLERVELLSTHRIRSLQDEVAVKKTEVGWSVEFLGNGQPQIRSVPDQVLIRWRSADAFEFETIRPGAVILSYSTGRMSRVTR